jgi:hypothetical protein
MKEFKVRCSSIGEIMTKSRSKSNPLSKTTESYLQEWVKEQIYGAKNFKGNKYTQKGIEVEDESINYIADELGYHFLAKNESHFENDFLTGTPDVITEHLVIDVKNSWDMFTFPLFEDEIPNKGYYYQLQGYMALTGKQSAKLIYTLMDTPDELINNWTDVPYSYEGLESKYRIKEFNIERDQEVILEIYEKVRECREYITQLINKI